jgi:hypothetical protein
MMLLKVRVSSLKGITHLVGWIELAHIVQYSSLLPSISRVALVSVPLWLITLSGQLWIIDLVGRYLHQLSIPRKAHLQSKTFL